MSLAAVVSLICCLAIFVATAPGHPLQGRGDGQCRLVDDVYVVVGTPGIKDKRDVIKQALLSAVDKELTGDGNVRVALYLWAQTAAGVVSQLFGYTTDKQTASSNVESLAAKLGQLTPLDQNPDVHLAQAAVNDYAIQNARPNVTAFLIVLNDREPSNPELDQVQVTRAREHNHQFVEIRRGPEYFEWVAKFLPIMAEYRCKETSS